MKRTVLITLFIGVYISLLSQTTWVVKTDGTGNFTIIQEAIVASASGDTIIVHPGRYMENIDFSGKDIYLTSLYNYTEDRDDIITTIIDGNGTDVVSFITSETRDACLDGFTIENGLTGIRMAGGNPTIKNCIIQRNIGAGGLYILCNQYTNDTPFLSGNVIKDNISFAEGGGIYIYGAPTFDPNLKNSDFNNLASFAHDMFIQIALDYQVPLDTFTVSEDYDNHIYKSIYSNPTLTFQFENTATNYINHDLYVSTTGDDTNNSGQTPESPFKTVAHAMYMIASDPANPKTIFVAPGEYGIDNTGEFFSIIMKSYVTLQGSGPELTIFNGEGISDDRPFLTSMEHTTDFAVKGIGFRNWGRGINRPDATAIRFLSFNGFEIENCHFQDGIIGIGNTPFSNERQHIPPYWLFNHEATAIFKNLIFRNLVKHSISVYIGNGIFENIIITGQRYLYDPETSTVMSNPPIMFRDADDDIDYVDYPELVPVRNYTLSNILIYDNEIYKQPYGSDIANFDCNAINISSKTNVLLTNATIVDNRSFSTVPLYGGPIYLRPRATLKIYNSIIFNNSICGINVFRGHGIPMNLGNAYLFVHNSLMQGEYDSIDIWGYNDTHDPHFGFIEIEEWGATNLDTNPLFDNSDLAFQYQLSPNSPAIGAGTLNLPNYYTLPLTDIMGNPRITNGEIDMGAYQRGSSADIDETITPSHTALLGNYPNPFNPETTISFFMSSSGNVKINIFNIKGQKIRTITDQYIDVGSHKVVWNGTDDTGRNVSSGIYFYQMQTDKNISTKKMVLMK